MSRGLMIIFTITVQDIPGTEDMAGARNVSVIIAGQTGVVITGTVMITEIAMTAATSGAVRVQLRPASRE